MTVARLHDSAECYIKVLYLTDPETKQLRWVLYRIVQAIKSLFNCSDWQKAKQVISNRIVSILIEEKLIFKEKRQKVEKCLYL